MNSRLRSLKILNHPLHQIFLNNFLFFFLVGIILFAYSLYQARLDLRKIADRFRSETNYLMIRQEVIYYKVLKGDNLEKVATTFNLNPKTIVWANDEIIRDELRPDMVIRVPPVDGVIHEVRRDDTTAKIAVIYKVSEKNIKDYPYNNFIDEDKNIPVIGDTLIVPGGRKNESGILGIFVKKIFNR